MKGKFLTLKNCHARISRTERKILTLVRVTTSQERRLQRLEKVVKVVRLRR